MLDAVDNKKSSIELRRKKRKTAEDLYSVSIKIRDNYTCRKCGATYGIMEAAHFITRGNKKIQFELINGFTLCKFKCHLWAHKEKTEFEEWVKEQLGEEKFYQLIQQGNTVWKETVEFYEEKITVLREFIKRNK